MEEVASVVSHLTRDGTSERLNDISVLYKHCESPDLRVVAEALKGIGRVLVHYRQSIRAGTLSSSAQSKVKKWVEQHGHAYHAVLAKLATTSKPQAQVCAVRLAIEAAREEAAEGLGKAEAGYQIMELRIQGLMAELLTAPTWSDYVAQCLTGEFVKRFLDVRQLLLTYFRTCCKQVGEAESEVVDTNFMKRRRQETRPFVELFKKRGLVPQDLFSRVYSILSEAPAPVGEKHQDALDDFLSGAAEDEDGEMDGIEQMLLEGRAKGSYLRNYRRLFQDAWLQLLGLPVSVEQCPQVLQFLPIHVMEHLGQPLMLADFYLRAFDCGSNALSVQSLSGLLLLLTKYGMGDPELLLTSSNEFYSKLYSLIKPETFRLRKRARFQRLMVAALNSGILPARFAAAFAKRCMRTAVGCTDPGSTMWLMAVAYGLIQKHHSHCRYLLHQELPAGDKPPVNSATDSFHTDASLPEAVKQVADTSLWELPLLQRHHLPAVVLLTKLFLKPFFHPSARKLDPELFLDQSADKTYRQALRSGDRQMAKWKARGEKCPVAFQLKDDESTAFVAGWAAVLSTVQRKIGAES